jgi:hypothetical protein
MLFRPLSVLASKLPSIFWGIDTGALYETWKQHQIFTVPARPGVAFRVPPKLT